MKLASDQMLLVAILSAALSVQVCGAIGITDGIKDGMKDGMKDGNLRRKRNDKAFEVRSDVPEIKDSEFMLSPEEHLEDLWSRAMTKDEKEMLGSDRFLQMSLSFSIPTRPPSEGRPTTPRPTPQPTNGNLTAAPSFAPSSVSVPTLNPTQSPSLSPSAPTSGTTAPSANCLTGTTRSEYLLGVLTPVSDAALLVDPNTPQGMAFAFIVEDTFIEDPCTFPTIEQRFGLVTFYYATIGASWTSNDAWLSPTSECTWLGVTCTPVTNTTVEKLQLALNQVAGTIPNEISTLSGALRLDLFGNSIGGSLPTGLSNLTQLELLDLEENALVGQLFTPEVLSLTNLVGLRGSFNDFTGQLPGSINALTKLEQLWFADNRIAGPIPAQMATLPALESLFGYRNQLNGPIPTGFGALVNFTQIRLYQNALTGALPVDLFDATSLETIRLDDNQFITGTIPTTIGNLAFLEDLRLFNNTIFGSIPSEVGSLLLLENLILNNNFLSGTIAPATFGPLSAIEFIDLSNNNFLAGSLPSTIFDIPLVRNIYIANCSLTGTLPTNYGTPPSLRDLFLDGNNMVGAVPEISSGQLLGLNELLLQNNLFTGSMPASICLLRDNSTGSLEDLWADCMGTPPELACDFPSCCNRCFGGDTTI